MSNAEQMEATPLCLIDPHSYETGRVLMELALRNGIEPVEVVTSLELTNCHIGGYACFENSGRVGDDISIIFFIEGMRGALYEAGREDFVL